MDVEHLPQGVQIQSKDYVYQSKHYYLLNAIASDTVPDGKYLYSTETKQIEIQWIQGIGSEQAAAPQARLMATVINGILKQQLPWGLVLLGVFLVVTIELLGIRSLAFAVGSYLSIGTTLTIFCGGIIRWLVERGQEKKEAESEVSPGSLFSSGLIAGAAISGLAAIAIRLLEETHWLPPNSVNVGPKLLGPFSESSGLALIMFLALCASLFGFARKKLE